MVTAAGIRRPIIAGVVVGCVIALIHNHFDEMRMSHDQNPFAHHNNGGRLGNHWESRTFASEHAVITEEKASAVKSSTAVAANTDIVVEVPAEREGAAEAATAGSAATGRGGGAGGGTQGVHHGQTVREGRRGGGGGGKGSAASDASGGGALTVGGAVKPLSLTYPDPFKVFKGCAPEPPKYGAPRRLDLVADPNVAEWPVDCEGGGFSIFCFIFFSQATCAYRTAGFF